MFTPGFPLLSEPPSDIETGPTPDTQAGVGSEMMDLLHDLQSRQDAQQKSLGFSNQPRRELHLAPELIE